MPKYYPVKMDPQTPEINLEAASPTLRGEVKVYVYLGPGQWSGSKADKIDVYLKAFLLEYKSSNKFKFNETNQVSISPNPKSVDDEAALLTFDLSISDGETLEGLTPESPAYLVLVAYLGAPDNSQQFATCVVIAKAPVQQA